MTLTAGDALLMQDTMGKRHTSTVKGKDEVLALIIHLE